MIVLGIESKDSGLLMCVFVSVVCLEHLQKRTSLCWKCRVGYSKVPHPWWNFPPIFNDAFVLGGKYLHFWCTSVHFTSMVDKFVLKRYFDFWHLKSFECNSSIEKCPTQDQTKSTPFRDPQKTTLRQRGSMVLTLIIESWTQFEPRTFPRWRCQSSPSSLRWPEPSPPSLWWLCGCVL